MGKRCADNPQGDAETHALEDKLENIYIYSLSLSYTHTDTHRGYMMRVPLKQSVNQSHTNSQGFVVAIRDGGRCSVTVDTADSH